MDLPKKDEFLSLFQEFLDEHFNTPDGQKHIGSYQGIRSEGKRNFTEIVAASDRGGDFVDILLLKLLPYADTEANRKKGAWIHIAPAIQGDLKAWFQNVGWTNPEDWPAIASAILGFLRSCQSNPENITSASEEFSLLPLSKGFQTGMLSPILNALLPSNFLIVNSKSRKVINYFADANLSQGISDYPAINELGKTLHAEIPSVLLPSGSMVGDLFDMFCHWLVAIKQHPLGDIRYWKIAPGEQASEWEKCLERGYIGVGWEELGDLSKLSFEEYLSLQEKYLQEKKDIPGWSKAGMNQAWKVAREIKEGDRIVANKGTTEVVGIGTVIGPYFFVPGERFGHRIPVDWNDTTPRKVNEGSWIRTLFEIKKGKFEQIESGAAPSPKPPPTISAFSEKSFQLLSMLKDNPKIEVYSKNKEDVKAYVEAPFQALLKNVATKLPTKMHDVLETEKNIFSRIPKNDHGQGGAWDFYWGAFYPKGGKRIEDAQLFIIIRPDRMSVGFYLGKYSSSSRDRFLKNCSVHNAEISDLLKNTLSSPKYIFGEGYTQCDLSKLDIDKPGPSWKDWLKEPDDAGIGLGWTLPKEKVLSMPHAELVDAIVGVYKDLFPLVILSVDDNPIPQLHTYLETKIPSVLLNPAYTLEECSKDIGIPEDELARWIRAINRKKQAIIYGPPGTGKTFVAEHLANHLVGGIDGLKKLVQFHPSYAYEDFVQGIRPQAGKDGGLDYPVVPGVFLEFCDIAKDKSGYCVLIIDEINRANLSRVFGELMYLLEYRNSEIPLASGGTLRIPDNIRIIGTMNTADRSIALVDHALRRRFAFIRLYPDYQVLRKYHEATGLNVDGLIETLASLNERIGDRHYAVGITFFLQKDLKDHIEDIWGMEIEPYLEEYFFDQPGKYEEFCWKKVAQKINL